ncbi:MAG TPA: tetratricopeptide repeat protein, partial [Thermodesulfovibrionales bacterium]|nr:tetratricopeptide repeat protein [Thermodesulfovibrionales bacterium]
MPSRVSRFLCIVIVSLLVSCASQGGRVGAPEEAEAPADAYYDYLLGYGAELSGNWEDALRYYQEALQLDPSSAYLQVQIAYIYLKTGRAQEATRIAEKVVKSNPKFVPGLILLGQMYNSQNRTDEAIALYEKAVSLDPAQN